MKVLGKKIRERRKEKKLSQIELAEGICTQATVSKIENKNRCESLDVFSSICSKLGLSVFECLEETYEQEIISLLDHVENLSEVVKHKEAYEIFSKYEVDVENLNPFIQTKYFYYKGSTSLLGASLFEEALVYLKQGIIIKNEPTIYNILSMNAIGIHYELQEKFDKARGYNERAYKMIREISERELLLVACKLFFNLAKFCSSLKDYKRSIQLCNQGINLCKSKNSIILLDNLLYEKAYNEYFLTGETEGYRIAYYFTKFVNHEYMMNCIKKDMKDYQIKL